MLLVAAGEKDARRAGGCCQFNTAIWHTCCVPSSSLPRHPFLSRLLPITLLSALLATQYWCSCKALHLFCLFVTCFCCYQTKHRITTAPSSNSAEPSRPRDLFDNLHNYPLDEVFCFSENILNEIIGQADDVFNASENAARNEKLQAVLRMRGHLMTQRSRVIQEKRKQDLSKLLGLSPSEIISMSMLNLNSLVCLMKSAQKYDSNLCPSSFDSKNATQVAATVIDWKIQMERELNTPRQAPDAPPPVVSISSEPQCSRHVTISPSVRLAPLAPRPPHRPPSGPHTKSQGDAIPLAVAPSTRMKPVIAIDAPHDD